MNIDERVLFRGFCAALFDQQNAAVKKTVRSNDRINKAGGRPADYIPRFPLEIAQTKFFQSENDDFRILFHLCSDKQQFVNLLSLAIDYLVEVLLIGRHQIKGNIRDIDLSDTIPVMDFSNFELTGVNLNYADLRASNLSKVAFKKSGSSPTIEIEDKSYTLRIGDGNVTLFEANIANTEISYFGGKALGYDQYRVTGAFGNAAKNNLVGLTYPRERETHKPFRLFIDSDEILPADVIATALFLFSPNREIAYEGSNDPQAVLDAIAGESHRMRIISDAIIKASHSHPQSARNFEEACQTSLFQKTQNNHDRFVVWRGLCLGR